MDLVRLIFNAPYVLGPDEEVEYGTEDIAEGAEI